MLRLAGPQRSMPGQRPGHPIQSADAYRQTRPNSWRPTLRTRSLVSRLGVAVRECSLQRLSLVQLVWTIWDCMRMELHVAKAAESVPNTPLDCGCLVRDTMKPNLHDTFATDDPTQCQGRPCRIGQIYRVLLYHSCLESIALVSNDNKQLGLDKRSTMLSKQHKQQMKKLS